MCLPGNFYHMQLKRTRAEMIGNGVFLIILGVLFYYNWWWPGILIAIWAAIATRQILTGRHQEFLLTTILFVTLFVIAYFKLSWDLMLPLLFIIGGGFIIVRELIAEETEKNG